MKRLTKSQLDLLASLPRPTADYYKPALNLVTSGMAVWRKGRFTDTLHATDAGRRYLAEHAKGTK